MKDDSEKKRKDELAIQRDNQLTRSPYLDKKTLRQQKTFGYALAHAKATTLPEWPSCPMVSIINMQDMFNEMGLKGHDAYSYGKTLTKEFLNQKIILRDDGNVFEAANMIEHVHYDNDIGRLKIGWTSAALEHTIGAVEKYNILPFKTYNSWKSVYSLRLYEIFYVRNFFLNEYTRENPYAEVVEINELKYMLGLCEIDEKDVNKFSRLRSKGASVTEALEAVSVKDKYSKISKLKSKVLDPACGEINSSANADFSIDYELVRSGRGGKTSAIKFFLWPNERNYENENSRDYDETLVKTVMEKTKYTNEECISFLRLTSDVDKIATYCEYADTHPAIDNKVGWVCSAIQGDWELSQPNRVRKTGFSNYEERDYDYADLQRKLVLRSMDLPIETTPPSELSPMEQKTMDVLLGIFTGEYQAGDVIPLAEYLTDNVYKKIESESPEKLSAIRAITDLIKK